MTEIRLPDPALVVLGGTAGCGKSTFAREHFADHEVVSSDECRRLVSGDPHDQAATADAFDLLTFLLAKRLKWGRLTVVDATNVRARERGRLLGVSERFGLPAVALVLHLPLQVCLERDAGRDHPVGEDVIRRQHRALRSELDGLDTARGWEAVHVLDGVEQVEEVRFARDGGTLDEDPVDGSGRAGDDRGDPRPPAVIIDLDGTLTSNAWRVHHLRGGEKDWRRFFEEMGRDAPVGPLVDLVRWLSRDVEILLLSGRPDDHEATIRRWLAEHRVVYDELFLRGSGDRRPDTVVKRELYRDLIADRWDVAFAVDDRQQVIEMWRHEGIYVLEAVDPQLPPFR